MLVFHAEVLRHWVPTIFILWWSVNARKSNPDLFQPLSGKDSWVFGLQAIHYARGRQLFSDAPAHVSRSSHSESHRTGVSFLAEWVGQVRFCREEDGGGLQRSNRLSLTDRSGPRLQQRWPQHHLLARFLSLAGSELPGSFCIAPGWELRLK